MPPPELRQLGWFVLPYTIHTRRERVTQNLLPLGDEACNARPEPYLRLEEPVVVFAGGLGLLRMVQHLVRGTGSGTDRVRVGIGVRARASCPNPNHRRHTAPLRAAAAGRPVARTSRSPE